MTDAQADARAFDGDSVVFGLLSEIVRIDRIHIDHQSVG